MPSPKAQYAKRGKGLRLSLATFKGAVMTRFNPVKSANRSFAVSTSTVVALLLWGGMSYADIISGGAQVRGGAGTAWSSDLGLDHRYPISLDDTRDNTSPIGPGSTTMSHPFGHYLSGESVYNSSYYVSPGFLGASQRIDIAPAGDVAGMVHRVHMESKVPQVGVYGLGAQSAVDTNFFFGGGTPHLLTTVYYAFNWNITTGIVGPGVNSVYMEYAINVGGIGVQGTVQPQNLSGTVNGSFTLLACGSGSNSFSGSGCNTSRFYFGTLNTSGSSNLGGTSTMDVAFAFSEAPITLVPEPAACAMLLAGLGLLGFAARRRKQKEAALA